MKNKLVLFLVIITLAVTLISCSSEEGETSNNTSSEKLQDTKTNEAKSQAIGLIKCGEVYKGKELSYNIIGVRTKEYSDGVKNLILKLEVFNHSNKDINYTSLNRLTVFDTDNTEYTVNLLADVETDLNGNITPNNKIMGEVAFEITDSNSENYTLHVGNNFEYSPAIEITSNDIDKIFEEQFEESGVTSDYTIGVPVESEQLTVLLKDVTVKPSDKEGKEILLCDLDVTNNTSETKNFMLGINFHGVYTANGVKLDEEVNSYTLQTTIEANGTVNGIASFYIEEGQKDFYMTVTPNLKDFSNKRNIVFTVE